jgi:CubicO group peptidase (beta-lactamase class C family)
MVAATLNPKVSMSRPSSFRLLSFPLVLLSIVAAQAAPTLPGVGAAMQGAIDAHETAGAVTFVATKDKVLHLEATGFADFVAKKPMTPDTMFWLASSTKPITATAALMMQDEGKLKITDLVAKYIPAFGELKTPSGKPANITIQHLLTHTSGLADIKRPVYFASKNLTEVMTGYFSPVTPMLAEPGERWKYNSFGLDTVGRIVEIVSGKPYDVFLQERIFGPLGMKDTTFFPTDEQQARLAVGYSRDRSGLSMNAQQAPFGRPVRGRFPPVPGGGLFSTAPDLGRFGQMLLNRGNFEGRRYLSEASFKQMTTIHTGELPTGYSAAQMNHVLGWGLGVFIVRAPHEGLTAPLSAGTFGHPGAWGTDMIVDPVKGVVYVMMIQRSNLPDNFENEPARVFVQAADQALAKNR